MVIIYILKQFLSAFTGFYLLSSCAALSPHPFSFTLNVSKVF